MSKLDKHVHIEEEAEFLGVVPNTVWNWGRRGKIPELRHPLNK